MSTTIPSPDTFEAIESAVMETQRGRWFLTEYASRMRGRDTAALLEQMRRLESAVTRNHEALMARLAASIAGDPAPAAPTPAVPELAPKHMKYFKRDEDIFEPAPKAAIAAVKTTPPPPEEKRGAKLTITRLPPAPAPARAATPQAAATSDADAANTVAEDDALSGSRRIVIVRHQVGDVLDLPQGGLAQAG